MCPIAQCARNGYNVTILAYGQTGSGKTWSMLGSNESTASEGIVPRTLRSLLEVVTSESDFIDVGFFEIYNVSTPLRKVFTSARELSFYDSFFDLFFYWLSLGKKP